VVSPGGSATDPCRGRAQRAGPAEHADLPYEQQERTAWIAAGRGPTAWRRTVRQARRHARHLCGGRLGHRDVPRAKAPASAAHRPDADRYVRRTSCGSGVDGCGAPVLAVSLTGLARAFSRLPLLQAAAMRRGWRPRCGRIRSGWAAPTRRDRTHSRVPGLIAKDGAESVYAVGWLTVAVSPSDCRWRSACAARADSGGSAATGIEAEVLDELAYAPVLGHGEQVGSIEAVGI